LEFNLSVPCGGVLCRPEQDLTSSVQHDPLFWVEFGFSIGIGTSAPRIASNLCLGLTHDRRCAWRGW
jgi:hypothetical protein